MKKDLIIRAWKDPEYRARLSPEERASFPASPCGRALTELDETELLGITGGLVKRPEPSTGCTDGVPTCGIINCSFELAL